MRASSLLIDHQLITHLSEHLSNSTSENRIYKSQSQDLFTHQFDIMAGSEDDSVDESHMNGGPVPAKKPFKLTAAQKSRYPSITKAKLPLEEILGVLDKYVADVAPQNDSASSTSSTSTATAKSTPPLLFPARIKLNCKEGEQTYDCGHEVMRINSSWENVDLRANIKDKFTKLQKADGAKRSNLGPRSFWSDIHDIVEIKTSCVPNAVDAWTPVDEQGHGQTFVTDENCADVLDMIKNVVTPILSVVIAPRQK